MNFLRIQNRLSEWRTRCYTRLIRSSFGALGKNCFVLMSLRSYNPRDIFIGDRVFIGADGWIDCFREYGGQTYTPRLEIGSDTMIGHSSHIMVVGHMKIGKHVMMANKVYVTDNIHGYEDANRPIVDQPLVHRPVEIEDQVWLGENVCVLPGVTIGKHSVIGSNSVVTRDVPPYCVAVGAPAKVIRRYDGKEWHWTRSETRAAIMRSVPQSHQRLPVARAALEAELAGQR